MSHPWPHFCCHLTLPPCTTGLGSLQRALYLGVLFKFSLPAEECYGKNPIKW